MCGVTIGLRVYVYVASGQTRNLSVTVCYVAASVNRRISLGRISKVKSEEVKELKEK